MPNMTSDAPMIEARDIRKAFGANQVLRGVSLQLRQGEVVAVIGPSGSGKSTFLRCLNHLETIDSGHIAIEGETLVTTDAQGRCVYAPDAEFAICRTGMVFQHFTCSAPHGAGNLIEAPWWCRACRANHPAPNGCWPRWGLSNRATARAPAGGQKQRVAIARALCMGRHQRDEPTSALDRAHRRGAAHHARLADERMTMLVVARNGLCAGGGTVAFIRAN